MRPATVLPVSLADIDEIAIALGRTGAQRQYLHSGIFYRNRGKEIAFLELIIDGTIRSGTPDQCRATRFIWSLAPVDDQFRREQLATLCELIAVNGQRVPYGFKHVDATFSLANGSLVIAGNPIGLTCATLVLAVFASHRIELIDTSTWQLRDADTKWQQQMIEEMRNNPHWGVPAGEIDLNESDVPCLRYSPDDIMGAALAGQIPASFETATRLGGAAIQALDAMWKYLDWVAQQ